jgi:hypothetical protein
MEKESVFFDKRASCSGKHYRLAFIQLADNVRNSIFLCLQYYFLITFVIENETV